MNRSHVRYVLVIAAAMLALSACDKSSANTSGDDNNKTNNPTTNNPNNKPIIEDGEGPDEDAQDIKPGPANGLWRVATDDLEDRPIVIISILQDAGKPELAGDFNYIDPNVGETMTGDIAGTYTNNTLTVTFNPTAQQEELFTLSAIKQGADMVFKGTLDTATGDSTKVIVTLVPD